jgi:hypothetical protein
MFTAKVAKHAKRLVEASDGSLALLAALAVALAGAAWVPAFAGMSGVLG